MHFLSRAPVHGRPRRGPRSHSPPEPGRAPPEGAAHGRRLRGALCQPAGQCLWPWSCRVHGGSGRLGACCLFVVPPCPPQLWDSRRPPSSCRLLGRGQASAARLTDDRLGSPARRRHSVPCACPYTRTAPGAAGFSRLPGWWQPRGGAGGGQSRKGSTLPRPRPLQLLVPEITFEWPVRGSPCDLRCIPSGSRDRWKAEL